MRNNQTESNNATPWAAVLRPSPLSAYLGMSRSQLSSIAENDPTFPRKIKFSNRCVGWRRAAIDAWLEAKERGEA